MSCQRPSIRRCFGRDAISRPGSGWCRAGFDRGTRRPTAGAMLDNSCRYPQMMDDWFINIACTRQVPRRRLSQFVPEIVIIFTSGYERHRPPRHGGAHSIRSDCGRFVLCLEHISSAVIKEGAMQNGPKTVMSTRQSKPAGSFAARPKRWTPSAARPQSNGLKAPKEATSDIWR